MEATTEPNKEQTASKQSPLFWFRKSLAAIHSYISFSFVSPILDKGHKGELNENSASEISLDSFSVNQLAETFQSTYKRLQASCDSEKAQKKDLVVRAIILQYGHLFLCHLCWATLGTAIRIAIPLCLRGFLVWIEDYKEDKADYFEGWLWGLLLTGCALAYMLGALIGYRVKVSMIAMVHTKLLKLSSSSISNLSAGHIVNLVSNDVKRFEMPFIFWLYIFFGPLEMAVVLYLLSTVMGFLPAISGLACFLLLLPLQGSLCGRILGLRKRTAEITDKRINSMEEAIIGILAVKMLAWEDVFTDKIEGIRKKEHTLLKKTSNIKAIAVAVIHYIHIVSVCVAMIVMRFTGGEFDLPDVFFAISLFALPRVSMASYFTLSIHYLSEMLVTTKRLDRFFKISEKDSTTKQNEKSLEKGEISLQGGDFGWSREIAFSHNDHKSSMSISRNKIQPVAISQSSNKDETSKKERGVSKKKTIQILSDITLDVKPGELIGIVGKVGSGKSSLLMALLNDMEVMNADPIIHMSGKVAYCAQIPFITATTIRENIIFGRPFDEDLYNKVIWSCELNADIEQLPFGDATVIGERGINLSGGQKARISLARAAYSMPDISLLDDPLSALDARVANVVFERCIGGTEALIKKSTRVLVTHQKQFLAFCDRIFVMDNGKIKSVNSVDQTEHHEQVESEQQINSDTQESPTMSNNDIPKDNKTEKVDITANSSDKDNQLDLDPVDTLSVANDSNQIVKTEGKESGKVSLNIYWEYLCYMGVSWMILCVVLLLISRILYFGAQWWIAEWALASDDDQKDNTWVWVLIGLTGSVAILASVSVISIFTLLLHGSTQLHNTMLKRVLHAPISFFHTNPAGRILNRFSDGLGRLDEEILLFTADVLINSIELVGTLIVVLIALPYMLPVLLLIACLFYRIHKTYIIPSREIKRYESLTRSPVFAMLSSNMKGLATIRTFKREKDFHKSLLEALELHGSWLLGFFAAIRWFGFRMDAINVSVSFATIVTAIIAVENVSVEVLAVALTHMLTLSGALQWCVQQMAELENTMTAAERNLEYTKLEQEPSKTSKEGEKSLEGWPTEGSVDINSMTASYRPGLNPVLNDITFKIPGGSSVGIVGRTGSGKSSFLLTLFRLIDINKGSICIDGIDTSEVGLDTLRKQIAVIPQDPVLFGGTFRSNLDPCRKLSDARLWSALQDVHLDSTVTEFGGLNALISESGNNLSAGQRQLLCLARALLGDSKLLALDEATANVDHATDVLIQHSLHSLIIERKKTLLIIAHRIDTILDCDLLVVLQGGKLVEFGRPSELLAQQEGAFRQMVEAARRASKMCIE
eukprot:g7560.t1